MNDSDEFSILDAALTLSGLSKGQRDAVIILMKLQEKETRQKVQDELHAWAIKAYEWFQEHDNINVNSSAYNELCRILGKAP